MREPGFWERILMDLIPATRRIDDCGRDLRGPFGVSRHAPRRAISSQWRSAYLLASRGEVGVSKHYYVATNSGHFSERSAAYLACGRPVITQDTGFSDYLPCGRGLFAFRTTDEAAAALDRAGQFLSARLPAAGLRAAA